MDRRLILLVRKVALHGKKREGMETVFFYYTVIVIAVCLATAISALGALVITDSKKFVYIITMFVLYAFDLVVIFEGEYMNHGQAVSLPLYYGIEDWPLKMILAAGVLESAWLIACDFVGEKRMALRIAPAIVFCAADCLVALFIPEAEPFWQMRQMLFYSAREVFIAFILIFCAIRYFQEKDPLKRQRMLSAKWVYIIGIPLTLCIVVENSTMIFLWVPSEEDLHSLVLLYFSSRNFSENTLMLVCAFFAIRSCWRSLSSRAELVNQAGSIAESHTYIESLLPAYVSKHHLTERETEIMRLIVQGKDNQNIASELHVALGTVKSHVHNIMQKAGKTNRDDLIKDFWSTL